MDKFAQSQINYKQTLKNAFPHGLLHPMNAQMVNLRTRKKPFFSSFLCNYFCVRGWRLVGGGGGDRGRYLK